MRGRFFFFTLVLFWVPFFVMASCPIDDFDNVVPFCTEDNELGITYPAGTGGEDIPFFYEDDDEDEDEDDDDDDDYWDDWDYWDSGYYTHNTGCLGSMPSPAWFVMQIEKEGPLIIEMSHSELADIDFACYGPFSGSSKSDVLKKICDNPSDNFYTSVSVEYYDVEYPEFCTFSEEFQVLLDSVAILDSMIDELYNIIAYECDEYYYSDDYWEYWDCAQENSDKIDSLRVLLSTYSSVSPYNFDVKSNCFRGYNDPFPNGKMVDCSYSSNAKEICMIENAKKGEWYLLLITNYSQEEGDITFKKYGGDATTNCSIIVDASVNNVCEGGDIELSVNNAPDDATFSWTGPNGFSSNSQSPVIHNASKEDEGTYSVVMKANGMTSPSVDLEVVVNQPYHVDTMITVEYGHHISFGGSKLSVGGNYTHTFVSENGCDSVVDLKLVVLGLDVVSHSNAPLCVGQTLDLSAEGGPSDAEFRWRGPNGTSFDGKSVSIPNLHEEDAGLYTLVMAQNGEETEVAVEEVAISSFVEVSIDTVLHYGDSILLGSRNVSDPGIYKDTLVSQSGCDSIVILQIKSHEHFLSNSNPVCEGESFIVNIDDYYPESMVQWYGPNGLIQEGGYTLRIDNVKSSDLGTYSVKFVREGLLVDNYETSIIMYEKVEVDTSITLLPGDSYRFGNKTLSEAGVYVDSLLNAHGCDSIVKLTLKFEELDIHVTYETPICSGKSVTFEVEGAPTGMTFNLDGPGYSSSMRNNSAVVVASEMAAGLYTVTGSLNGRKCFDESYQLDVLPLSEVRDTIYVRTDSSLPSGGSNRDYAVVSDTLKTLDGCDSVLTHFYQKLNVAYNGPLCEGDRLTLRVSGISPNHEAFWRSPSNQLFPAGVQWTSPVAVQQNDAGVYSLELLHDGSVVVIDDIKVDVYAKFETDTSVTIYEGDTLAIGSNRYYETGTYAVNMKTVHGCDSLINLSLQVKEIEVNITTENNGPLCEGESLVLTAHDVPNKVKIKWMGPNGFSSEDSVVTIGNVSSRDSGLYKMEAYVLGSRKVEVPSTHVDVYSIDKIELFDKLIDSVYTFNDLVINKAGDYTVSLKNVNGCDSIVTLHLQWAWDSIQIVPDPYFTPNGDGVRDFWYIEGVDRFPSTVKIYDRYGKSIRMYENYSNEDGWDGKDSKGDDMPSSDYWFVIVNRTIDKVFVGHVTLIR